MKDYHIPTQVLYETAKRELTDLINKTETEYGLPNYLIEGLLGNALAQVRDKKCNEVVQGYSDIIRQISPEEELEESSV